MFEKLDGKWIVGVSGQNDSMALLHMCIEKEMDILVCIIDYKKRDASKDEVSYVKRFCREHNIQVESIEAPVFTSNFQKSARDFRYKCFNELKSKYQANGVLLAHHLDDHLETIAWQFERNHRVLFYGLKQETTFDNMLVKRPLLFVSKEQLSDYNKRNNIIYFEDESNLDTSYTRNRIRKQLEGYTEKQKQALLEKANEKNKKLKEVRFELNVYIQDKLDIEILKSLNKEKQRELLWMYCSFMNYTYSISKGFLDEIIRQCTNNNIGIIPLKKGFVFYYQEGKLELSSIKNCNYKFTFDTIKNVKTKYFTMMSESDTLDGVCVSNDDFPIIIRNVLPGDKIHLEFGHQKITTWFNQEKISWIKRRCWPVVLNKNNEIIYVVGWRCDVNHSTNNPNLFVLK